MAARKRTSSPPERRVAPRYAVRVPVEYQHPAIVGRGTSWDISSSGVRVVDVTVPIRVGAGIMLRFSFFPESQDTWFPGDVVRHTKNGFAVEFADLEPAHLDILGRVLPHSDEPAD